MANFKQEPKYKRTTEYIYLTTANRLKERKLSLNLTDSKIAGDYDRKIISRIVNNTRSKNNVYLIPTSYINLLMNKLKFDNTTELFYGNVEDEIFIENIFCNLLLDILDEYDDNASLVNDVLIDYIPYAKIVASNTSIEYVNPEGGYLPVSPIAYINNVKQFSYEERNKIKYDAILRLFKNTCPKKIITAFLQEKNDKGENKGFSKLYKRLDAFVNKEIILYLKNNLPKANSLGLRVYSIVKSDMTEYVELEFINAQIINEGLDVYMNPEYNNILKSLIPAGNVYIEKLEKIQRKIDKYCQSKEFNGFEY